MSQRRFAHSPDLAQLCDEGYEIEIRSGHLLVHAVPYVISAGAIERGILVAPLTLAGDIAAPPGDHTMWFAGGAPCDHNGIEIAQIRCDSQRTELFPGCWVDRRFSAKPIDLSGHAYPNFYSKVRRYVEILGGPVSVIEPTISACTFGVIAVTDDASVFTYADTASARAGISVASARLAAQRVAIVGVGGTGSYVLDFVVKTHAREIHTFDADVMLSHNGFRAPGAISIEELRTQPPKVKHFAKMYGVLRRGIIAHEYAVSAENVHELFVMDFVFVCIDNGPAKRVIFEALIANSIPFVDVGMGLYQRESRLGGTLVTTAVLPGSSNHTASSVSFSAENPDDEYDQNAQIVELNALNAALAVIKWKKVCGFYGDLGDELHCAYTVETNSLVNSGAEP